MLQTPLGEDSSRRCGVFGPVDDGHQIGSLVGLQFAAERFEELGISAVDAIERRRDPAIGRKHRSRALIAS